MVKGIAKSPEECMRLREKIVRKFQYSADAKGLELIEPKKGKIAHHSGYVMIAVDGKTYLEHRLVWFLFHGEWPTDEIDHINGDKTDNSIENLRVVDRLTNVMNRAASTRSKTGICGIFVQGKRFAVRIKSGGKSIRCGSFLTLAEAYEKLHEIVTVTYGDEAQHRLRRIPLEKLGLGHLARPIEEISQ